LIKKNLVSSGQALPHHIYPESGWVRYWIRNSEDIPAVINLFKLQFSTDKGFELICPVSEIYNHTSSDRLQLINFYDSELGQAIYS
jgi:hypothetical protein